MKAAAGLLVAVKETDEAVLPFPNIVNRFDTLPPGQQAIKIIPSATLGWGFVREHNITVNAGKKIICDITPVKYIFGFSLKKRKSSNFKLSATANIISASDMESAASEPLLSSNLISSMLEIFI